MYATVSELKELKEWLLGNCKDINEQPRTELEKEIKIKDKLIKELNNDNDTLLSYQKELETKIQDLENDPRLSTCFDDFIEGFKEDVTYKLKKELEVLKAEYASLKTENSELRKANQAYLSYQFKLEEKTKELEKGFTYWKSQSKEIALAKNPNEELQEQKNYFENEYYRLVRENNELQSELEQAKKSSYIQGTTKELFTMPQDKINVLMFKLASIINKEYPYNTKFTTLDNLHENIIQVVKFMQSKIYDLENKNKELVAEYESLEQKKINLEVEVESLNSEFNDIKQVLKQSNKELKDELNLSNEVIELQANLIEAKAIVDLHLSNIESLKKDKLRLQETNNKLNQDNQRLYNQNCDLSLSLNKLKSENDNLRTENYELENLDNEEIKKLSKEIENLSIENSKVYHRNKELTEALKDITTQRDNLEKEIDSINLENSKVWNRNRELEETSKKFIDLNTKIEAKNKELANDILKTSKELETYKIEFDKLADELDKYEQPF